MSDRRERIDDLPMAIQGVLEQFQSTLWTAMPAIVTKVDLLDSHVAIECQPSLRCKFNRQDGSFDWVEMPVMTEVPVVFPSGGGFILTFPIHVGDEVLVVFANRCIDAWWQNGGVQNQIEFRMHDLSDGFALPGPRSLAKVPAPVNPVNVQLRNDQGDAYVEITTDKRVRLQSSVKVEIEAINVDITATNTLKLQAASIQTQGNLTHSGNFAASGGTFTHNSKNVGGAHTHGGVTLGDGTSGGPT